MHTEREGQGGGDFHPEGADETAQRRGCPSGEGSEVQACKEGEEEGEVEIRRDFPYPKGQGVVQYTETEYSGSVVKV